MTICDPQTLGLSFLERIDYTSLHKDVLVVYRRTGTGCEEVESPVIIKLCLIRKSMIDIKKNKANPLG